MLCLIVFCFSCILAEKFSFQREDGEYSDLRSGKVLEKPFRVRGLPSHGCPQWRPFGQTDVRFWPQPLAHSSGRMA